MEKRLRNGSKPTPIQAKLYDLFTRSSFPENFCASPHTYIEERSYEFVVPSTADPHTAYGVGFIQYGIGGDKVAIVKPNYLKLTNKLYIDNDVIKSDWQHAKVYRYKNYTEEEILNIVSDFIKYHKETVIDKRLNDVKKDFE
jgi:hypothetical protein